MVTVETRNLSIGYTKPLFTGLNLQMHSGQMVALLGLNGAGKSTLLKTLCGFLKPLEGDVAVMGKRISTYQRSRLATIVGVVLTERTSAGGMSVFDLVSMGRYPHTDFLGKLKDSDIDAINSALNAVGISHKANNALAQLSDGERQKAFIAKALAQQCPVIILDEPTAFLDVKSRIETMDLLSNLAHEQSKTILLSTHDLDTALRSADMLWVADSAGKRVECGTAGELLETDIFGRIFGPKVAEMVYSSARGK